MNNKKLSEAELERLIQEYSGLSLNIPDSEISYPSEWPEALAYYCAINESLNANN